MIITKYLNIVPEDISLKKHNIWIGVSLGNKYFTKEHLTSYIEWSLAHTRKRVAILVADEIYAINIHVSDGRSVAAATRKALSLGKEKSEDIKIIVEKFPREGQEHIEILRWRDMTSSTTFKNQQSLVRQEFQKQGLLYGRVMEIVSVKFKNSPKHLTKQRLEEFAEYVIQEIPMFFEMSRRGYTIQLYPGLGLVEDILMDLQHGTTFPNISEGFKLKQEFGIIEAYA